MMKQPKVQLRQIQKPVHEPFPSILLSSESNLAKPSMTTSASSSASSTARPRHLQPVLLEDKGYYQLGPETASSEIFSFSITIYSAKNLVHVSSSYSFDLQSPPVLCPLASSIYDESQYSRGLFLSLYFVWK